MLKIYFGETSTALGSYDPNTNATGNLTGPHGRLAGFSAQQRFNWNAWAITQLDYIHLAEGQTTGDEQDPRHPRRVDVQQVIGSGVK